jgi:hypothetical protein
VLQRDVLGRLSLLTGPGAAESLLQFLVIVTSYVQVRTVAPLNPVSTIVSFPVAELPLNVIVVEMVDMTGVPATVIVQRIETVHVAESTFVVHPEAPLAGAVPLSPQITSLPLIVIV